MQASWCSPRVTRHGECQYAVGGRRRDPPRPVATRHEGRLDRSPGAARPATRGGSTSGSEAGEEVGLLVAPGRRRGGALDDAVRLVAPDLVADVVGEREERAVDLRSEE